LAFAVVLGTGYGGWIALQPTVLAELFGVRGLGGLVGLSYMEGGIGALVGPPLAGLLVDATGGYRWAIAAAGLLGSARSWRSSRYSRGQRSADLRRAAGPTALDRTTAMAQAAGVVWVVERVARDLDKIVADYIDDALLITPAARCAARTAPGRHSPDYSPICPC
jgi:MFS family permease